MTVFRDPYTLPIAMDGAERRHSSVSEPVTYDRDSYAIVGTKSPRSGAQDEQIKGLTMSPEKHELAIKYLMERLPPEDQAELKSLLGEEDMPSVAEDSMRGRNGIAFDKLPDRMRRQAVAGLKRLPARTAEEEAAHTKEFPHMNRLR